MRASCVEIIGWLAFLVATRASAASPSAYENTAVEDPLQPIWNRLDNLSGEILRGFQAKLEEQLQQVRDNMEEKYKSIVAQVDTKTSAINNNIMNKFVQMQTKFSEANTNMTAWITNFYTQHMRNDADDAVRKLEEHVDVKVSASENKLKEYINTLIGPSGGQSSGSSDINASSGRAMEHRLMGQVTNLINSMEAGVKEQLTGIAGNVISSGDVLETINTHVSKINEKLAPEGDNEGGNGCSTLVDKVSELLQQTGSSTSPCSGLNDETVHELTSVLEAVRETPGFLPRDCSDYHWHQPEAPSGVFKIYPTMDSKTPVSAWCEMGQDNAKENGGWTVILRRRNTTWNLIDFNRTWSEYRAGFGMPGEGEWWYGLDSLHALTYRQPYEVRILMHDIELGYFQAMYSTFRVEDESRQYRLIIAGFKGNVSSDALSSKHNGSPFSTYDRDNDQWSGNCAVSNSGGWWFNSCHHATLTAPFPASGNRDAKTIRWLKNDLWLVLDDVTVMVRPANYASRFRAHVNEK